MLADPSDHIDGPAVDDVALVRQFIPAALHVQVPGPSVPVFRSPDHRSSPYWLDYLADFARAAILAAL